MLLPVFLGLVKKKNASGTGICPCLFCRLFDSRWVVLEFGNNTGLPQIHLVV